MNNRNDWTRASVEFLSVPFRCASELGQNCGQVPPANIILTQPNYGTPGHCPLPASRQASDGVNYITYPPDKAYYDHWMCRVNKYWKR